jgi:hypothetical protein
MLITDRITNGKFRRYFPESSGTVHSLITLLIKVVKNAFLTRHEKYKINSGRKNGL